MELKKGQNQNLNEIQESIRATIELMQANGISPLGPFRMLEAEQLPSGQE